MSCAGPRVSGYHLDGARLWNAHVATGVSLAAYGSLFDTVSVCFSKGLGAPVGSVLVSTAANIAQARIWRKRLGGGWRQAGILAAGALHALDHHVDRLAEDHEAAAAFAAAVADRAPSVVDVAAVQTNIVVLNTGDRPRRPGGRGGQGPGCLGLRPGTPDAACGHPPRGRRRGGADGRRGRRSRLPGASG